MQSALLKKTVVDKPKSQPIVKRGGQSGIIEIDLHIGELLDDTHGMSNSEILNYSWINSVKCWNSIRINVNSVLSLSTEKVTVYFVSVAG